MSATISVVMILSYTILKRQNMLFIVAHQIIRSPIALSAKSSTFVE